MANQIVDEAKPNFVKAGGYWTMGSSLVVCKSSDTSNFVAGLVDTETKNLISEE